ncbi:hypothetical protein [Ammoniphilus sp. YIM 78166]|uniref:YphA family membrane protein n=1 Tax=Ammoniphilus sp. YIM 78166 TaxID=1644106 RepID=UPI00106F31BB|nr:hypothetical protein [Ammoniphilus sp. YIM 78166]
MKKHRVSKAMVSLVLLAALIGGGLYIELPENGRMMVIPFVIPLAVGVWLWIRQGDQQRLHLLTASFLIGASLFFMQLLLRLDPVLMFIPEKYMLAGFVVILVLVAARKSFHQYVLLSLGLGLSDLCIQAYMWNKTGSYVLGASYQWDVWWISFYLLIAVRGIVRYLNLPKLWKRKRAETTS